MRSWEEIRSEWNNVDLMTKRGRGVFIAKILREQGCGMNAVARELKIDRITASDLISYVGFTNPLEEGVAGQHPPTGAWTASEDGAARRPPPTGGAEVVFGEKGSGHSLNEIVQNYEPDEEEVEKLVEEGYTEPTARRLSRAAEAGRDAELEQLPSGKLAVVKSEPIPKWLQEDFDATAERLREGDRRLKWIDSMNFCLIQMHTLCKEKDPQKMVPNHMRSYARELLECAMEWENCIRLNKEQNDD